MSTPARQEIDRQNEGLDAALLLCLKSRRDAAALEAARPLLADPLFDWPGLLEVAAAHRVTGLLHDALDGTGLPPASISAALRETYNRTAFRNLFLLNELGRQLGRLQAAGVNALVLKGAGLAVSAYRTIGLRPMVDADLLIRRDQVPVAVKVLAEAGYEQGLEPRPGAALEFENEIALHKRDLEPVRLDIHWSLFDSHYYQANLSLDWFWDSARPHSWQGFSILVPGPEAQLIHLCGHMALHHARTPSYLWLNDLCEVVWSCRRTLRWEPLMEMSQEMNLVLPLQTVLGRLATEWDAPIPDAALERLRSLPVSSIEERLYQRHTGKHAGSLSSRVLPDLLELPAGRQLRFIWAKLVPSAAYMRRRYEGLGRRSLPFLYLHHLWAGARAGVALVASGIRAAVKDRLRFRGDGQDG